MPGRFVPGCSLCSSSSGGSGPSETWIFQDPRLVGVGHLDTRERVLEGDFSLGRHGVVDPFTGPIRDDEAPLFQELPSRVVEHLAGDCRHDAEFVVFAEVSGGSNVHIKVNVGPVGARRPCGRRHPENPGYSSGSLTTLTFLGGQFFVDQALFGLSNCHRIVAPSGVTFCDEIWHGCHSSSPSSVYLGVPTTCRGALFESIDGS